MADDVEEFIAERGLKLPTLIGHSMSVFVEFAIACPRFDMT